MRIEPDDHRPTPPEVVARAQPASGVSKGGSLRDRFKSSTLPSSIVDAVVAEDEERRRRRREKLERIREELESGTYSRSPEEVAKRMIVFFEGEGKDEGAGADDEGT